MTWRWPWVSRERHVEAVARQQITHEMRCSDFRRIVGQLQEQLLDERRRYDDLLARYHALKLQGATIPEPAVVREVPKVDPIEAAINIASAGKDVRVLSGMRRQVQIDKDAGLEPADIILRIQRGNRPAEEIA